MRDGQIQIRKARQNNLAGVDVDIPRNRLVAVTGVSGSGKSSLAFDTLYREGQRRFLETLSAYARQFLGNMEKPDVESIEGLSPAIAVDQSSVARGPRSTVGTLTEITDHLRVLFARAGRAHCPKCKLPVRSQTPEEIVQQILREAAGRNVILLAPVVRDRKGSHRALLEDLRKKGFVRARVDGEVRRIEEVPELARYARHTVEAVVDRLKPDPANPSRLREALETAFGISGGEVVVSEPEGDRSYSTSRACPGCGGDVPALEPRLFSFNSPHGACPECEGLGVRLSASAAAVVRDPSLSIHAGALAVTLASGRGLLFPRVDFDFLGRVAAAHGFDLDTAWEDLPREAKKVVLHGTGEERYPDEASWNGKRYQGTARWMRRFGGVLPAVEKGAASGAHKKTARRLLASQTCPACGGSRLKPAANAVLLGGASFAELTSAPVGELEARLAELDLTEREARIARDLLAEIRRRIGFLAEVGLSYLTLDRSADTLSSGEAQRIRLAAQLGAGLQGVLYVLDEPSIGLHARDQGKLLGALLRLRDLGNTVVVVEHDEATLRAADWLVDVGPGAGRHGGRVLASGPPAEVALADTPTGRLLRGEIAIATPARRREGIGKSLIVEGARAFNLKDVDVEFPLGTLTVVAGVSGSGKTTLVSRILERAALRHLGREADQPEAHDRIRGLEHLSQVVTVDGTPIGRTPRSNPATYTGVLTPIRDLFAALPEARMRGYDKSRFSFNVAGGRCEACGGAGAKLVELQFLAPVTVPCEECGGHRFQAETLAVRYQGKSIADVLAMTAEEALELFRDHPKIARPLATLVEIGLSYLQLGQPSTTLSGGEAQRIKLATELQRRPGGLRGGHTLYVLDEPTTGLHQDDVARLVAALQKLVDLGHTVLVVEHNLDLVLAADHVVELGPEGGSQGGRIVAEGTPEAIERTVGSPTGAALRDLRRSRRSAPEAAAERGAAYGEEPPRTISLRGARTHNLKSIDVDIPRDALTVVTGPSGSGKSSLALDTIHTEGRRRFVESLSTYARQFLGTKDRPPVDRIDGLGPSVAVEGRSFGGSPRSTVATTTEIHDHLRVLYARAGLRRCPVHGEKLEKSDASRVARAIASDFEGRTGWLAAPIADPGKDLAARVAAWQKAGFARLLVDGVEVRLEAGPPEIEETTLVHLVVDRLSFGASTRSRIAEAVEQAEAVSGRVAVVARGGERREYSTQGLCPVCGFRIQGELEPRHFSFNTHVGACEACGGLGENFECDEEKLFTHPDRAVGEGAIHGKLERWLVKGQGYYERLLGEVCRVHKIDLDRPWKEVPQEQRNLVARGQGARPSYRVKIERTTANAEIQETFTAAWPGLCGHVDAWHAKTEDAEWAAILQQVMSACTCSTCRGERLKPEYAAVTIAGKRLPEVLALSVSVALGWIRKVGDGRAAAAVSAVVAELRSRLSLLDRVGLSYLTLDRLTSTLSGGEARRVRLSAALGSELVGVCYVLDEPTVGLHPRDVDKLALALQDLRARGNTVIAVEHDLSFMERADWLVDLGPGAGREGGTVVATGTPADVARHPTSATAAALRGEIRLSRSEPRGSPRPARERVKIGGARLHNLRDVEIEAALGEITGVCGPSGSGKSTLVLDTLVPALRGERPAGRWKRFEKPAGLLRTVVADAGPIGRTPASCPATYTGVMEPLRELFTRLPEARARGFEASRFSFNSPKGRCPACEGKGATAVEMQFLADLWLTCEECDGTRYAPEVLEVRWRGLSIADVLDKTAAEAFELFEHHPAIARILATLVDVGLGYVKLGQSSTTLSSGEAQRMKLASELFRADGGGRAAIVLDEPSTGLSAGDLVHLARVLDRLAARGDAVVLIEHHAQLLAICDRLVELGPEGGEGGGRIVASGTPRDLARDPASITGPFLAHELERETGPGSAERELGRTPERAAASGGGDVIRPENPLIVQGDRSLMLHTVRSVVDGSGRPVRDEQGRPRTEEHPRYVEARDQLALFAELEKSPDYLHTYRITPVSIWNAAAMGIGADRIQAILEDLSCVPVPRNVLSEVREWVGRYGMLRIERVAEANGNGAHAAPNASSRFELVSSDPDALRDVLGHESIRKLVQIESSVDGTSRTFVLPLQRGSVKQALIKIGYPVDDRGGYLDGDRLEVPLRDATLSGRPFALRPYQRMAADQFWAGGSVLGGSGVVVLPCGAGKTVVGMAVMNRVSSKTLILTTNTVAVRQWREELLDKTTLAPDQIGEYTGEEKVVAPVTITTYQMLTWRRARTDAFEHIGLFSRQNFGLIIYDEVHLLPAPVFRVTADLQARRRLGLTATLVREDGKEDEVFCLIGPKRCDVPWKVLEGQGFIAAAACVEVRVPLDPALRTFYTSADARGKYRVASENPAKIPVVERLIARHREGRVLVIGQYIDQLNALSRHLKAPLITGKTPVADRERLYAAFRTGEIRLLVVSKVGNFAIDLPDANVAIQISGTFGSRQEEAQRLGRILRPKADGSGAVFYSVVTLGSRDQDFAQRRQVFLTEQGYTYEIVEEKGLAASPQDSTR